MLQVLPVIALTFQGKKLGFKIKLLGWYEAGLGLEAGQSDFRLNIKQKPDTQHPFQGGSEASPSNVSVSPHPATFDEWKSGHAPEKPVFLACPSRTCHGPARLQNEGCGLSRREM